MGSHGKIVIPDGPVASIVRQALEGYASGCFQIQAEVKRFLEAQPQFPKARNGGVLNQNVTNILTRPIYAGYVESPCWGVSLRQGRHEALISFETYKNIQARLTGNAKTPARRNLNQDFPLRGAVVCGHCSTPLTACWSSGRGGRYPYYLCPKKGFESYGKSVRRDVLEGEFDVLVRELQPAQGLFECACVMFEDLWNRRLAASEGRTRALKAEGVKIERQIEQPLDRIVDADSRSIVRAYESRIRKLEERKIEINEKIANCGRPIRSFDETLRTALDFLGNPHKLWVPSVSKTSGPSSNSPLVAD